jgi:hypothetical protein
VQNTRCCVIHLTSTRCREYCSPKLGVFGKGSSPRAKAGRGDHPGVKLGPRFFDDSSFWFGQVSASGSEFGVGLSARFAREKLQTGPRRATFACEGVAVGPTKSSPRRWHQRCSFPSQCGTPAREVARPSCRSGSVTGVRSLAARGCAVAPDKDQPGASFLSTIRRQAKRPPQPSRLN